VSTSASPPPSLSLSLSLSLSVCVCVCVCVQASFLRQQRGDDPLSELKLHRGCAEAGDALLAQLLRFQPLGCHIAYQVHTNTHIVYIYIYIFIDIYLRECV
jgi:hypothetical protein